MAATIDATIKGANANSYVTLTEANSYFETVPDSSTWTNKTDDQKNRALIAATREIDNLVFYGENQAEYGNNVDENYTPTMDKKFFSVDDPMDIMLGGKSIRDIISETDFKLNDFKPYIPPKAEYLESKGVEVHYLGYYLPWDPQECYYYATENTGFQSNSERTEGTYSKYSSIDDKIDMFHYLTTLVKFGIGRATYDAAQEIRNNKIGIHKCPVK